MTRSHRSTPGSLLARRTVILRVLGLAAGLLTITVAGGAPVGAASPSLPPGPSPSDEPRHLVGISAWLDAPIPADAPAGSTIDVGLTIVETEADGRARLSRAMPSYLILSPATGDAPPSRASTRSDWPGHVHAAVPVPDGGPGTIEVGFEGQECHDDGSCRNVDVAFANGGVGPPPDVPRAELVTASIHPPAETPVAGRKLALDVEVTPRAAWDLAGLGLPDRVIAIVNQPRGPDVATAELIRNGAPGSLYEGSITIPTAGDYGIAIAFPGTDGQADQVLAGATARLVVEAEAVVPTGVVVGSSDEAPPWPWIAGLAAVAIVAGYGIKRAFADL